MQLLDALDDLSALDFEQAGQLDLGIELVDLLVEGSSLGGDVGRLATFRRRAQFGDTGLDIGQ